ncbi:hypothetical protein Tco_0925789 [Tanacetum coccineum]|uniref:Uncharacterized protein n=1 Tax=Tanacetum coccineum TaxID=301880 RepID=A0ABQ5D7U9_9ASTR
MYHKKNLDFVPLIWEDLAYQIANKDSKKQDKMLYPRFTNIIIPHFLTKDKSISMRNKTFMHTARDDSLLGTMRFVSRHEDTQVYGALLPKAMTNQSMLNFDSYKTYYAIATGAEPSKSKKTNRKSDSAISSKETPSKKKPTKAKKDVPSTKKPATKPKLAKKKVPVKVDRGDGTDFQSGVPDEQQCKISGTNKGTSAKPWVPDVPKYDYESDKESWGDSGEKYDDDEDDTEDDEGNEDDDDNDGDDDDDNDSNDNDDKNTREKHKRQEHVLRDKFTDKEDNANKENEEELDDGEELYKDVNVNLRKEDVEMTDADQSGADQHNVSQDSGFEQKEEDAHVTLTTVQDAQKTKDPMQSSSVSSDFIEKLLNFENVSPADNEIDSLMDTTVHHKETSGQTSSLYTVPVTIIPEITFNDRVTNLERDLSEIKQVDQYAQAISSILAIEHVDLIDTLVRSIIKEEVNSQLPQAVSEFATHSTYEAAASLSVFELKKILMDKMEEHKSYLRVYYKRELYDALIKSYNTDKDLFDTYGEVFTMKRSRDDKDKDQDTSVGSD